jgi:hypothetical protein
MEALAVDIHPGPHVLQRLQSTGVQFVGRRERDIESIVAVA